jgi:TatD DNase family protein
MPIQLIDTHAHLDDEKFRGDLPAVLDRAQKAGVYSIITIGVTAASSQACWELANQNAMLFASVGIQPNEVAAEQVDAWDRVLGLAGRPKVVAIGETGLDRYWNKTPLEQQKDFFARHLALARTRNLASVIHCREAEADVVAMLKEDYDKHGPVRAVMHSFTGEKQTALACLSMGLHISFAGMLTYKDGQRLREVAAHVPLDRVLVETDSPYLSPIPLRGQRNEPAHVIHTATSLAGVLGLAVAALATHTTNNARVLFGLA